MTTTTMVEQDTGKSNPFSFFPSSPSPEAEGWQKIAIAPNSIMATSDTQAREGTNTSTVEEYAEAMQNGSQFPPLVIIQDKFNGTYWLADGFHRLAAAKKVEAEFVSAYCKEGTRRDALLYALGANSSHGLRRTNADKRRAVELMLSDPEWWNWSDREIARRCAVSDRMVNIIRAGSKPPEGANLSANNSQIDGETATEEAQLGTARLATRNGTTYEVNTANINAGRPAPAPAPAPAQQPPTIYPGSSTGGSKAEQASATAPTTVAATEVREISDPTTDLTAPSSRQEDALVLKKQAAAHRFEQHYASLALRREEGGSGSLLDFYTARLAARLIMFQYYNAFQNGEAIEHAQAWLRKHDLPDQTEVFQYFRLPMAWIDSELARIEGQGEGLNDPAEVIRLAARLFTECALTSSIEFSQDASRELSTFLRQVMNASAA